ncbi:FEM1B [Lepeophtheirus salmonis]|uniref:Protein fem-1 homolog B n=1 Tax=Lepeophtheirus salmonis TaxID=72036 RepID=A0A7R8CLM6_LEPSM|nr:FEM1B [Lepeophtheirus salmonis]CAF2859592.1 FEM1B [Lepeophtheirus salmonis]
MQLLMVAAKLGATALWVAAASGHGTIVTALIRKVNHATSTQSTPIRAACFAGKLDIVQYLVACGADIHIANKFNGTCLMIAAYNGYIDIVIYLIQNKVDVHVQASFIMARMNPSSIQANKLGMTPIKAAAERCRASVVEHFIDNLDISYDDKIDAIELLGASFANDKECYDHLKSLHYIRRALELRESENILKENLSEPISAYGNFSEIQSSSELRVMQNDEYRLQMEGLIMRERILGTSNLDSQEQSVGGSLLHLAADGKHLVTSLNTFNLIQLPSSSVTKMLLKAGSNPEIKDNNGNTPLHYIAEYETPW